MAATAPRPAIERSTIEHVASAAGVSVATVSRALRGLPNVAVATRARVEEVARELNYRADPAASRLAAGRSHTVAVVVPMINSWYFSNVVAGAEAVCSEGGYDLLVVSAPTTASRHEVITTVEALHRRVDGMIFVEVSLAADDVEDLRHRRLGVVTIGQDTGTYPSVQIDNEHIGRIAARHLVELGHRRIGILGAQAEDPVCFDVPGQRIEGARQVLAEAGLDLDPQLVAHGEFTVDGGQHATPRAPGTDRPPDRHLRPLRRDGLRGHGRRPRARPRHPGRRLVDRRGRPRRGPGDRVDHRAPAGGRARGGRGEGAAAPPDRRQRSLGALDAAAGPGRTHVMSPRALTWMAPI